MRDIPNAIFHIGFVQGRLSRLIEENEFRGDLKADFDKCLEHLGNAASCLIEPETDQDSEQVKKGYGLLNSAIDLIEKVYREYIANLREFSILADKDVSSMSNEEFDNYVVSVKSGISSLAVLSLAIDEMLNGVADELNKILEQIDDE